MKSTKGANFNDGEDPSEVWAELVSQSTGPLAGMRIIDLTQQLPGPYGTLLLSSLGASVVKIEPPSGDVGRHLDPQMFENINAGKITRVMDLKTLGDRKRLYDFVSAADVFIEGFRPGVTLRLGCDYPMLKSLRPNLIYVSISGFGQEGPLASHPAHDLNLQAIAGALHPSVEISRIGIPWVDLATGTTAALAIVAAFHRGQGAYLDLSLLETALAWSSVKPNAVNEEEPTYGTLISADGYKMVIALLEDAMWARLCSALNWEDWRTDSSLSSYLARRSRAREISERLKATVAQLDYATIARLVEQYDLPIGSVDTTLNPDAKSHLAHILHRHRLHGIDGKFTTPLPLGLTRLLDPSPPLAHP